MKKGLARFLTRLYPPKWRARFGEEFLAFLESRQVSVLEAVDIAGRALAERASETWRRVLLVAAAVLLAAISTVYTCYLGLGAYLGLRLHPDPWLALGCVVVLAVAAVLCERALARLKSAPGFGRAEAQATVLLLICLCAVCAGALLLSFAVIAFFWIAGFGRSASGLQLAFRMACTLSWAVHAWVLFFRPEFHRDGLGLATASAVVILSTLAMAADALTCARRIFARRTE